MLFISPKGAALYEYNESVASDVLCIFCNNIFDVHIKHFL